MDLYSMKTNVLNIGQSLKEANDKLAEIAVNPASTTEDITAQQKKVDSLQKRYNTISDQLKKAEAEQKANLTRVKQVQNAKKLPDEPEKRMIAMEAAWIRKTVRPDNAEFQEKWNTIKQEMKDDSTSQGGKLLPINVSNQLISEPFAKNPLRQMETVSTITNLILPRIAFDIADDSFVDDGEIAKEMSLKGDQINFERHQVKVRAGISDTVLLGTDTGLVQYVNDCLASALQLKERNMSLGTSNPTGLEHMSFYDKTTVKIKEVAGSDLFHAIRKAIADLDDAFQDNAKVLMTRSDYYDMLDGLANNSATLYQAQPESILGVPVVFTSAATTPVVCDFSFAQLNYEISSSLYEQYKDYQKGMNYFQLTAWFDHQIKLASAFRLATVSASK